MDKPAANSPRDSPETVIADQTSSDASLFRLCCAAAILLSAFLVFQVQPIISKMILPWFGGGPAVWSTSLLFFQLVLLAGYGYAHAMHRFVPLKRQAWIPLALLASALLLLPIAPGDAWKPTDGNFPTQRILWLLLANVGLPYLLLSASAPLLQSWYAARLPGEVPYRLYALSNVGSLGALLSFPFLVEPRMTSSAQSNAWSIGFAVFTLSCAGIVFLIRRFAPNVAEPTAIANDDPHDARPSSAARCLQWSRWIAFSTLGSITLLAVTNHVCQEMSVSPILWVVPLSLYLLTFIICFDRSAWYQPRVWSVLTVMAISATTFLGSDYFRQAAEFQEEQVFEYRSAIPDSLFKGPDGDLGVFGISLRLHDYDDYTDDMVTETVLYVGTMFLICMVCHGELVRSKPEPQRLTSFYLAMATGGAAGGVFVAIVCTHLFSSYVETRVALIVGFALALYVFAQGGFRYPKVFWTLGRCALAAAAAPALFLVVDATSLSDGDLVIDQRRNFYGLLRVKVTEADGTLDLGNTLYHGQTLHGFQYLDEEMSDRPTTYYGPSSGIGTLLEYFKPDESLHVGVVGLGTGTIAYYGMTGDTYHFFEIDTDIIDIARNHFTYLENSGAEIKITLGDARVSLERSDPQHFDVLVLDAFSGDAIPLHLLTDEAFDQYLKHVKPDGAIVVHTSNRYLNLVPVVEGAAVEKGLHMIVIEDDPDPDYEDGFYEFLDERDPAAETSDWVILTPDGDLANEDYLTERAADPIDWGGLPNEWGGPRILWTDHYSNLLEVLQ